MKLVLLEIGKTKDEALEKLIDKFVNRIRRFHQIEVISLKDARLPKSATPNEFKRIESVTIKKALLPGDFVVLLDEHGSGNDSKSFAKYVNKLLSMGKTRLVFVIGGAYGFDQSIYELASTSISLSPMTYSHQLIRLIFAEQLYRAFTIINNHPYHNE